MKVVEYRKSMTLLYNRRHGILMSGKANKENIDLGHTSWQVRTDSAEFPAIWPISRLAAALKSSAVLEELDHALSTSKDHFNKCKIFV